MKRKNGEKEMSARRNAERSKLSRSARRQFISKSEGDTMKIAAAILPRLKNNVVVLRGNLGSGKTVFARGIARALGITKNVRSPSFVLLYRYRIPKTFHFSLLTFHFSYLIHIDAYRLHSAQDLLDIGFNDFVSDPHNLIIIEWGEKVRTILPRNYTEIIFQSVKHTMRKIIVK